MNNHRTERWMRIAFISSVILALLISATYSIYRPSYYTKSYVHLQLPVAMTVEEHPFYDDVTKRLPLLTYIKRNYKRWSKKLKRNPSKVLLLLQKFNSSAGAKPK